MSVQGVVTTVAEERAAQKVVEEEKKIFRKKDLEDLDSLETESRLIDSMKTTAEMALWTTDTLKISDSDIESAYEASRQKAFGDAKLMASHKSKRKKSYVEKAKFQMEASKQVKKTIKDRDINKLQFLRDTEDFTVPEEYVGFMQDWCPMLNTSEYNYLKDIFSEDEQAKKTAAQYLLDKLHVTMAGMDQFEFENDRDFMAKFREHYTELCAFSSADKLLDILDDGKLDRFKVELKARIETFKDIREAYENRMQIMQSPYYALLLNSDLNEEDPKYKELKEKMQGNPGAKAYFDAVEKRGKLKFGKGMSANELYQKKLRMSEDYDKMSEHTQRAEGFSDALSGMLRMTIPSDPDELITQVNQIVGMYRQMTTGLGKRIRELEDKGSLSGKEMTEYDLAMERLPQYRDELQIFEIAAAQIKVGKLEPVPGVWENVLYNIRATTIDIDDPNLEMVGGGASTLYKVKEGDKTYFVKRQQRLLPAESDSKAVEETALSGSVHIARMLKNLEDFVKGDKQAVTNILNIIAAGLSQLGGIQRAELPKDATLEQIAEAEKTYSERIIATLKSSGLTSAQRFWDLFLEGDNANMVGFEELIRGAFKKENEYLNATEYAMIDEGAVVSDRNVSTSIMAKRLRLTDIVAESKTVLLDNGDGTFAKANAMEGVPGMEFGKLLELAKKHNCGIEYSPQALGQIFSLQVFDMICGQVDRHVNNYMVTSYDRMRVTKDGKTSEVWVVKSIKGIDNDLSFGNLTGPQVVHGSHSNLKGFTTNEIGMNMVKFLPAEMVRRLKSYQDIEAIRADFADTRSDAEITALHSRILAVLDQIDKRTAKDADPDQKLVLYESEEDLAAKYAQMQSSGLLTGMKAMMRGVADQRKPQNMDWEFVRDVPVSETETWEKVGDQDHALTTEDATYEADGDIVLNVDVQEMEVWEEDEDYEEASASQVVHTQKDGLHKDFEAAREELLQSKVSHMFVTYGDSPEMVRLKEAMLELNTQLQAPIRKGIEFDKAKKPLCYAFEDLIKYSERYIAHITSSKLKGHGGTGAKRLKLARDIMESSKLELAAIRQLTQRELGMDELTEANTWSDVLYNVRGLKMSTSDPQVKVLGSGTSVVYRMEAKDKSTRYIKLEERLLQGKESWDLLEGFRKLGGDGAEEFIDAIMKASRIKALQEMKNDGDAVDLEHPEKISDKECLEKLFPYFSGLDGGLQPAVENPIPREDKESDEAYHERAASRRNFLVRDAVFRYIAFDQELRDYFRAHRPMVEAFGKFYFKRGLGFETASGAGIAPGAELSSRNVSTSRLAKRLGFSDIIAESQTVVLSRDDGTVVRANAMEGVETQTMSDLMDYCRREGIELKMSPKAVKQLMNMELFDIICGQVDRNSNNYNVFYEFSQDKKTVTVTSLKGIDNDMSFGTLEYGTYPGKLYGLTSWSRCSMPFMDEAAYNMIVGLKQTDIEQLCLEQMDIRSPQEILALKLRIVGLQQELIKRKRAGDITLLSDDSQWEGKLEEMQRLYGKDKIGPNYFHHIGMMGSSPRIR
ncbi:MAG: hypothetical protein K6B14_07250 [Lachnospiraceae bacterium]|nr:hypothetical protein [Lachnospiraceae bacterium]